MSSAGSDQSFEDRLSCLHVMQTNIFGEFSLLMFLHCLGCSSPSDYTALQKKKKEINLELTGGKRRGREGQRVADVACGATLFSAPHAKTFWLCFLFPHPPLKSRLTHLAATLRWYICVGFWSCLGIYAREEEGVFKN